MIKTKRKHTNNILKHYLNTHIILTHTKHKLCTKNTKTYKQNTKHKQKQTY